MTLYNDELSQLRNGLMSTTPLDNPALSQAWFWRRVLEWASGAALAGQVEQIQDRGSCNPRAISTEERSAVEETHRGPGDVANRSA